MKITLQSKFHGTETFVRARRDSNCDAEFQISDRQWVDAWRRLCGMKDCCCPIKAPGYVVDFETGGVRFIEEEYFWSAY